jgi:hypothetical protein
MGQIMSLITNHYIALPPASLGQRLQGDRRSVQMPSVPYHFYSLRGDRVYPVGILQITRQINLFEVPWFLELSLFAVN